MHILGVNTHVIKMLRHSYGTLSTKNSGTSDGGEKNVSRRTCRRFPGNS